jgi:hypothetical protein
MKRTTVMLCDEMAVLVENERKRRDVSTAEVVREALAVYVGVNGDEHVRRLTFIGIGVSGGDGRIAERLDEILAEEWPKHLMRKLGRDSDS